MWIDTSDLCRCLNYLPNSNTLGRVDIHVKGLEIFVNMVCDCRAGDWDHIPRLRHLPRQNKLRQSAAFVISMLLELLHQLHVCAPILGHETRMGKAEIASGNAIW